MGNFPKQKKLFCHHHGNVDLPQILNYLNILGEKYKLSRFGRRLPFIVTENKPPNWIKDYEYQIKAAVILKTFLNIGVFASCLQNDSYF